MTLDPKTDTPHSQPQEGHYALTALQLLTRLPVRPLAGFEAGWVDRSAAYFPLAGFIVGLVAAAVLILAAGIWPAPIPAVLAVVAGIAVTGALHEDGLADTVDGLGGGATPEQKLAIMKDSRLGTYGAIALIVALSLKVFALSALAPIDAAFALILAHMAARAVPVVAAAWLPYVGDASAAKVPPMKPTPGRMWCAVVLGLAPFLLIPMAPALLALGLGALAASGLLGRAKHALGGVTGDVLGAAEQVFEVAVLLGLAAGGGAG